MKDEVDNELEMYIGTYFEGKDRDSEEFFNGLSN